jgi:hypothetical protein
MLANEAVGVGSEDTASSEGLVLESTRQPRQTETEDGWSPLFSHPQDGIQL